MRAAISTFRPGAISSTKPRPDLPKGMSWYTTAILFSPMVDRCVSTRRSCARSPACTWNIQGLPGLRSASAPGVMPTKGVAT